MGEVIVQKKRKIYRNSSAIDRQHAVERDSRWCSDMEQLIVDDCAQLIQLLEKKGVIRDA